VLLDLVGGEADPDRASLLGRVVGALAQAGEEALAGAGRSLAQRDVVDPMRLGAAIAVRAAAARMARTSEERCAVLELLADWLTLEEGHTGLGEAAADVGGNVSVGGDEVAAWVRLHGIARGSTHAEAPALVDAALGVLIGCPERIDVELPPIGGEPPPVPADAPVRPPVARLAQWLEGVTGAQDAERLAQSVRWGWRLGLVGQNAELDRQLALVLVPHLGEASARQALHELMSGSGQEDLLSAVGEILVVRAVEDAGAMDQLAELVRAPAIARAVRDYVERESSFGASLVALSLHLRRHPEDRREALSRLIPLLACSRDEQRLRELYGRGDGRGGDRSGPGTSSEHAELLGAYAEAGKAPPRADVEAAWRHLGGCPLGDGATVRQASQLAGVLADVDAGASRNAAYLAWRMVGEYPEYARSAGSARSRGRTLGGPMEWVGSFERVARRPSEELADERYEELKQMTARVVLKSSPHPEHCQAYDVMAELLGEECWLGYCEEALCRTPFQDDSRYFADLFAVWWSTSARSRRGVLERLLPAVLAAWPPRRREKLGRQMPKRCADAWSLWDERYPPSGVLSRTAGRLRVRRDASRR